MHIDARGPWLRAVTHDFNLEPSRVFNLSLILFFSVRVLEGWLQRLERAWDSTGEYSIGKGQDGANDVAEDEGEGRGKGGEVDESGMGGEAAGEVGKGGEAAESRVRGWRGGRKQG